MIYGLLLVAAIAVQGPAVSASRQYVAVKDQAFLMMPAEVAAGSMAHDLKWNATSSHLAVRRDVPITDPKQVEEIFATSANGGWTRTEIILFNRKAKTSRVALKVDASSGYVSSFSWIGKSQGMVVQVDRAQLESPTEEIYFVSTNGVTKKISESNGGRLMLLADPSANYAVIADADPMVAADTTLKLVDGSGNVRQVPLPWSTSQMAWEGGRLHLASWRSDPAVKTPYLALDPSSMRLTPVRDFPSQEPPEAARPLLTAGALDMD
ncbi:MAG TPA: hypothetical protein VFG14_10870, partial [Chthoniobacteraceae bacterium]|nr:hypothetical protein [Chthoniobacteraceae bacterium]